MNGKPVALAVALPSPSETETVKLVEFFRCPLRAYFNQNIHFFDGRCLQYANASHPIPQEHPIPFLSMSHKFDLVNMYMYISCTISLFALVLPTSLPPAS
jgi:hypothetical protein